MRTSRWQLPPSLKLIRPLPSYSVIAADTLRDLVTLTFDLLTLVTGQLVIHGESRDQPLHQVWRSYGYPLWVPTSPIGYHWQERAGHLEARFHGEGVVPLPIYIATNRKAIECATTLPLTVFYIMKICNRLFVLYCRSRPKYDNSRHFDPHFEEVRGSVEPWWMARWKVRAEFLLSVIELLFLSLTVEALQGKMCQKNCHISATVWSISAKFGTVVVVVVCFTSDVMSATWQLTHRQNEAGSGHHPAS